MNTVFLLQHIYEEEEVEYFKAIGLFTSREHAEVVAQRYRGYEGFVNYQDSFYIFEIELNKNYWDSGFKRIGKKDFPLSRDVNEYLLNKKNCLARKIDDEEITRMEQSLENEKNEIEFLYELEHSYETEEDVELAKTIGVYTSRQLPEEVIEKYRALPGFMDYPDGFIISEYNSYMINKNYWEGGFFRWTNE